MQRLSPSRCPPDPPAYFPPNIRPGASVEDDGWVIVGVHNAESLKGEIHILDARR